MFSVPVHFLTLYLFPVKSKRLEKRRIAHGKEYRVLGTEVLMAMPGPGGNHKKVSPSPLEFHVSHTGEPITLNYMVLADGCVPVRLGLHTGPQELDGTGNDGQG